MIHLRKCKGCFELKPKEDLIKITKLKDGTIKINPASKELGRSVYICKNPDCIKKFIKKKRLKADLKYSNQEEIEKIEQELTDISNNF